MTPEITFASLTEADLPLLVGWFARGHVAEWWHPGEPEEVEAEYRALIDPAATTRPFLAYHLGRPIGYIQSYIAMGSGEGWWTDERDPGVRGIDQFIGESDALGRGLGTAMVRAFVGRLFADPAVTAVIVDPDPRNHRAIRCYRRAGFQPQGETDTPDGPALLMRIDRPR